MQTVVLVGALWLAFDALVLALLWLHATAVERAFDRRVRRMVEAAERHANLMTPPAPRA